MQTKDVTSNYFPMERNCNRIQDTIGPLESVQIFLHGLDISFLNPTRERCVNPLDNISRAWTSPTSHSQPYYIFTLRGKERAFFFLAIIDTATDDKSIRTFTIGNLYEYRCYACCAKLFWNFYQHCNNHVTGVSILMHLWKICKNTMQV